MTRKKKNQNKKPSKNSEQNSNIFSPAPIPISLDSKNDIQKTIDIPNNSEKLEKAKTYINRLNTEYPNKNIPYNICNRKPTLEEFEAISTYCMGNMSEMTQFISCSRRSLYDFINKEENKEYLEIRKDGQASFTDFAVSKLRESVAGVIVLAYDKFGHEKVYKKPPDPHSIKFALQNDRGFEDWGFQNTSKTQNTNVNIDVNQLLQLQLEKMDMNELKQYTKSLLNDADLKGLIE